MAFEKEDLTTLFVEHLKQHHQLSEAEINDFLSNHDETRIPVSIFQSNLSALEVLCKYLKENLNFSLNKIAKLLKRDNKTIWASYHNATKKQPQQIISPATKYFVPIAYFASSKTVLLTLVTYLKERHHLGYHEIAVILSRNERNVWAVYNKHGK